MLELVKASIALFLLMTLPVSLILLFWLFEVGITPMIVSGIFLIFSLLILNKIVRSKFLAVRGSRMDLLVIFFIYLSHYPVIMYVILNGYELIYSVIIELFIIGLFVLKAILWVWVIRSK